MTDLIHGHTAPGLDRVRAAFAANFADGLEIGAAFAVCRDGEMLVDLWGGHADRAGAKPWEHDTIVPVFSTTKPIAAIVLALLVERGLLDFDAPLAQIWPDFAAAGKDQLTLAQVMSHQAGIPGFFDPIDPTLWLDPLALSAALAALSPLWPPGTAHGYHPLTYGYLVGEAVRRCADGRSLGTILAEDICGPRGIDFHIGLAEAHDARLGEMQRPTELPQLGAITPIKRAAFLTKWAGPDRGGRRWRAIEIPSANGHGTARAVARLYSFFAQGGRIDEQRLVSPAVFAAATARRAFGEDLVLPFTTDFAAGVMRNSSAVYGPNPESFGHSGWGGSMAFGDPKTGLSVAYIMNRQSNNLQGDPRARRLIDAVYAAL